MQNSKNWAPTVLRIGVAAVFLWFGISQMTDPGRWTALVPDYATAMIPTSAENLVLGNAIFEISFGILLLLGLFTRVVAGLLALHALHIMTVVGYSPIGIRDFGIFAATLSVFLYGADMATLDRKLQNRG